MKKIVFPFIVLLLLPLLYSCSTGRLMGYVLNERDAESAIRQLLQIGTRESDLNGAFTKETIFSALLPEGVRKVVNTAQQLGISPEVDRFTNTLRSAAEKTATRSVPLFVSSINNLKLTDAVRLVKGGGTSATDYLRRSIGDSLRRSLVPVMQSALDEYHLNAQWDNLVKSFSGNKLNLNLSNLMAGLVSEMMFQKIAQKELQIRSDAAARTTPLLQKVFSQRWQ